MRLCICTQAVDDTDSDLGFFVRWIEEFAKHCEKITVMCLRKGAYALPAHVEIIALGERNKMQRALELCVISWGRRKEYDAVFVHMNPEYIVAAGWLWRLLRKKISLWYVHKSVNLKLRIATLFAHVIFTASSESFRLPSPKVRVVGHGIDTDFFSPSPSVERDRHLLSAGRLAASKRHDLAIRAAAEAGMLLRIAGEGPERAALETLARSLGADVRFLGGLSQEKMRDEYRRAAAFIHTSETGSLDKVVLEALAAGCPVVTTSEVCAELPVQRVDATPEDIARALTKPLRHQNLSDTVREHHSLSLLIGRIMTYCH